TCSFTASPLKLGLLLSDSQRSTSVTVWAGLLNSATTVAVCVASKRQLESKLRTRTGEMRPETLIGGVVSVVSSGPASCARSSNSSRSATATRPLEFAKSEPLGPPLAQTQKLRSTKLQPRQSGTPPVAGLATPTFTPFGPVWV